MFRDIYITELKKNLKSVPFYIFTAIFFIITHMFASNTDPNVGIAMPIGKEWHNAPLVIARFFAFMSVYGILITIVFVGRSVTKDFSANIHDFFFTTHISKTAYLGGRLFGGLSINLLIFIGVVIGFYSGCLAIGPKYYGPFILSGFLLPMIIILIPNLLLIGCLFFSLATLSRKMMITYLSGVALLIIYAFISIGLHFMENDTFRILADPFAISSLSVLTEYWTVSDINTKGMPLSGLLILNRVIWLTVSFGMLYITWHKFKFVSLPENIKNEKNQQSQDIELSKTEILEPIKPSTIDYSFLFQIKQCFHLIGIEFKRIALHPAFLILTFLAMLNLAANFYGSVGPFANNLYPVTSWFLKQTDYLWVYTIPLIIIFGGVIVWRARDYQINQIYDTLPLPNWMHYLSKLFALMSILAFYMLMIMLAGIFSQVAIFNWTDIELGLYVKYLFGIILINYWYIAVIVLLIQNLVNNKYLGFFLCSLYFIADILIFLVFGYDNILLRFGYVPNFIYSNLNGFGHYGVTIFWYTMYWFFFAIILGIITSLLWKRNEETHLKFRIKSAMINLNRIHKISLGIFIILFLITGTSIYYNKYILNQYMSEDEFLEMRANYEKKYAKYENTSLPIIKHVNLLVDLYPNQRNVFIKGYYTLRNNTNDAIDTIFVNISNWKITKVNRLEFSQPADLQYEGEEYGFRIFKLNKPLMPEEEINLEFDLETQTYGFTENNPKNELAVNGTCLVFSSIEPSTYFPVIGYDLNFEISDNYDRMKQGLSKRPQFPALEEARESTDSFITYNAVISTDATQQALSNGNLIDHWRKNNRNYFHYKSDIPIFNDFVFVSGEYEVATGEQNSINLEIYYYKKHPWNISRIVKGMEKGIEYCSNNFGKYPFSTFRLVEVPNYHQFGAGGLPSLIIWNEDAGFISNVENPDDIDQLFGITTHEVTHNWWPGMILCANAEGSILLNETIAQYVRTMCLAKEYGPVMLRKHLKKEMDDYLRLRKKDTIGERPLMRSYFNYYMTYAKSSVVMYALQNYIGEDRVNMALKSIFNNYRYKDKSNLTSLDFIEEMRAVTPDSFQYFITDLFETITLWENKAINADYAMLDNGKYQVNLKVEAHKFRADSIGTQTEIPLNDYIYIAVLGEDDEEIYMKKHKFYTNQSDLEITVDKKPIKAGIDPYVILIDRNREDNLVNVRRGREQS
jgi:hypothetical protein